MAGTAIDTSWIWNEEWNDGPSPTTAGGFVDFRKVFDVASVPTGPVNIHISADTRYKLWINSRFVHTGPVKGDAQQWFFDELDIQPFLRQGQNDIAVRVLRLFPGSHHGITFVRMPVPGFYLTLPVQPGAGVSARATRPAVDIATDASWETSVDEGSRLPCNIKDDDFLHIYEEVDRQRDQLRRWIPAKPYRYMASYGIGPPWKLTPRVIPFHRLEKIGFDSSHNIKSTVPEMEWAALLLHSNNDDGSGASLSPSVTLPRGTSHHIELEMANHTTAFLKLIFKRPGSTGCAVRVQYSECYEDEPALIPYSRRKGDRKDSTKRLYGPYDLYRLGGSTAGIAALLRHDVDEMEKEIFEPFHFRTFRVIALDIDVAADTDLVFYGAELLQTNYDMDVQAKFQARSSSTVARQEQAEAVDALWNTSIRTLRNCMHDTYEDCPFYEQLQYAMDARSSILFTYCVSGDDRLARQAICQLYNAFQPALGLTPSRAPAHQLQIIPNFALYWVCMVFDHFIYFGETAFTLRFLSVVDAVLRSFDQRIDKNLDLVRAFTTDDRWEFVDWIPGWRPFGIPPAAQSSGHLTFTNALYAYTLKFTARCLQQLEQPTTLRAAEYSVRAQAVVEGIRKHCFDGELFTDGLARDANVNVDYSPHSQIWAALCGATTGAEASEILLRSLWSSTTTPVHGKGPFDRPSVAMSFYTLRALSEVGGTAYDDAFRAFWEPWRTQLAQNVTTWVEDDVTQRSDCHAWGSAPLYEFIAEVAGLKPAEPGFRSITFKPRLSLYPSVKAQMPINGLLGRGLVHVEWERHSQNGQDHVTEVSIQILESSGSSALKDIITHVVLQDGQRKSCRGLGPHRFRVSSKQTDVE
jgi:hypothetical protein